MSFLEKLRMTFRLARQMRAAQREGLSREDAMERAVLSLIDQQLEPLRSPQRSSSLPGEVAGIWRDPEANSDEALLEPTTSLEIGVVQISLLRQMHFTWETAEVGAPMLDPDRPYGTAGLIDQLRAHFAGETDTAIARRHVEMMHVLQVTLSRGYLDPGHYTVQNLYPRKHREALGGGAEFTDADLGWIGDRTVRVTEQNLKLLRELSLRWPPPSDCETRLKGSEFPAAAIDPKRPYGDMTAYMIDMARILDCLPPAPADGIFRPDAALADDLHRLHLQMLPVLQAFVEHARLEPGTYPRY